MRSKFSFSYSKHNGQLCYQSRPLCLLYDLYCLPDVNDRAIFFNKLRLQSQKFLHSHPSAEQKLNTVILT